MSGREETVNARENLLVTLEKYKPVCPFQRSQLLQVGFDDKELQGRTL